MFNIAASNVYIIRLKFETCYCQILTRRHWKRTEEFEKFNSYSHEDLNNNHHQIIIRIQQFTVIGLGLKLLFFLSILYLKTSDYELGWQ